MITRLKRKAKNSIISVRLAHLLAYKARHNTLMRLVKHRQCYNLEIKQHKQSRENGNAIKSWFYLYMTNETKKSEL